MILEHASSSSMLVLGRWRTSQTADAETCETEARGWREMPTRGDAPIDQGPLEAPPGFGSRLWVEAADGGDATVGAVLAFGARGRTCFAFAFTTRAMGEGRDRVVGERLALVQALTLEGMAPAPKPGDGLRMRRSTGRSRHE
ncbi:MAG: hypothetical protein AAGA56_16465 [Myxococcota bacterium]